MYALYIHSIYTSEINKVSSNPRVSIHYDTSKPCAVCGKTGHTFDEFYLLKNHDFMKIHCIQFSLLKKWLNQIQTYQITSSISQINTTNETDVLDPDFLMGWK